MTHHPTTRRCLVTAMLLGAIASTVNAQISYETRALSGDAAPGTEVGVVFEEFFGAPSINNAGNTAFSGALSGDSVDFGNGFGVWYQPGQTLELIARAGQEASGTSAGVSFSGFGNPILNDAGDAAFFGVLTGLGVSGNNNTGFWSQSSGTLGLIAREGSAAPGTGAGVTLDRLGEFRFNNNGNAVFSSELTGTGVNNGNDQGVWSLSNSSLDLVAREGEVAPGATPGATFRLLGEPVLNSMGDVALQANLDGSNGSGIWLKSNGNLSLSVLSGTQAAGTLPGVNFNGFGSPAINNSGDLAFNGFVSGTAVDSGNGSGIWSQANGVLGLVAREGDDAPGTDAGVVFGDFFFNPLINGSGDIAFQGVLTGTGVDSSNDRGIWVESAGLLSLVTREGDAAPGTAPGVTFALQRDLVFNGSGHIVFEGFLTGNGVNISNDRGIWAADSEGNLQLVARIGDQFDVNDDPLIEDLRTIESFEFTAYTGGEDGRATSLNDNGQFVFQLDFTDGTQGIFVANIPEPSSLALLALGGVGLMRRRRG